MKQLPSGTEAVRPFLPARDFELSKRFYEALGFRKLLEGDVVIFEVGGTSFLLQKHYEKNWAENFMMQLATCHKTPDGSATYAMRSPQGCSAGGRGGATPKRLGRSSERMYSHQASRSSTINCIMKFSAQFFS